jgi:hypothetical protein
VERSGSEVRAAERQSVLATSRRDIVDAVANLEDIQAVDLARLLDRDHMVAPPGEATFA